jgi:hypothetical protein
VQEAAGCTVLNECSTNIWSRSKKIHSSNLESSTGDVDSMQTCVKENHQYCQKQEHFKCQKLNSYEKHVFQIQTSEYSSEIENLHIHVSTPVAARNHSHMITM